MARATTARARSAARGRHWTEEQARAELAELKASGESAATFAQRKGVSRQRLYYWAKRVAPTGEPPEIRIEETKFVAVRLPTSLPAAASAWIELSVGGLVVRIRESLDADHVARLVEAIARRLDGRC